MRQDRGPIIFTCHALWLLLSDIEQGYKTLPVTPLELFKFVVNFSCTGFTWNALGIRLHQAHCSMSNGECWTNVNWDLGSWQLLWVSHNLILVLCTALALNNKHEMHRHGCKQVEAIYSVEWRCLMISRAQRNGTGKPNGHDICYLHKIQLSKLFHKSSSIRIIVHWKRWLLPNRPKSCSTFVLGSQECLKKRASGQFCPK